MRSTGVVTVWKNQSSLTPLISYPQVLLTRQKSHPVKRAEREGSKPRPGHETMLQGRDLRFGRQLCLPEQTQASEALDGCFGRNWNLLMRDVRRLFLNFN